MNYNNNNDEIHNEKLDNKIKHILNISNYIKYIADNIKNSNLNKKNCKLNNEIKKLEKNDLEDINAFDELYLEKNDNEESTKKVFTNSSIKELDLQDLSFNERTYLPLISNGKQNEIFKSSNENNNVIVLGANGTGKTYSMINLAANYIAKGNKVLIVHPENKVNYVPKFPKEYKNLIYVQEDEVALRNNIKDSIRYINNIISNKDIVNVARRIELFENEIKNHKAGLVLLHNEMKQLELQQGYEILDDTGTAHLPMYIYNTHKKDLILRDYIKYNLNNTIKNNKKCVEIIPDFYIDEDKILILRDQRDKVLKNLRDYIYECKLLPYIVTGKEYEQICKDLKEVDKLNEKIEKENTGISLIKDSAEYVDYVQKLKEIVTVEMYIKEDWQKKILLEVKDTESANSERYFALYNKLDTMMQNVKEAFNKIDSKYIISLNPNWNIDELNRKINDFVESKSSSNVLKKVFDNKLHKFETEIKVNGKNAKNASPDELEQIKYTVKYYYEVHNFMTNMEEVAKALEIPIKYEQNYTHITIEKLLVKYNQFAQIFEYVKLEEELKKYSERLIKIDETREILANDLPCTYYKLYLIVALHYKKLEYSDSFKIYYKMIENFNKLEKDNPNYQTIKDIKKCLENYKDNIFMARWFQIYAHLTEVEKYREVFDEYKDSIDEIYTHLPRYAEDLLDINIPTLKILPTTLNESIKTNVELEYVQELGDMENKLREISDKINLEEQAIISLKKDLINFNIQYAILKNITAYDKRLIEDYSNLDDSQEKVFLSNENNIKQLKNIIPIWIMNEKQAIELLDTDKDLFDYILIDEANKFNVLDLSLLTLAKKSIIFGDLNQLSFNDIVNKSLSKKDQNELEKVSNEAKKQYLSDENDIVNGKNYSLNSNLLKLLLNLVPKRCQIKLQEQYINMPKVIDICNQISYNNELVGMNVSDINNSKYPEIKEIYLEESKYEDEVNKDEAIRIINVLKESIENPLYINKSFGIISMFSEKQEEYIEKLLKEYFTTDKMKDMKLKVGMPKDFENDCKDVIIISMGINNINKENDTVQEVLNEEYISKLIITSITKCKEQLIIVHSINKDVLKDSQNVIAILINNVSNYDIRPLYNQNLEERCESQFSIEIYKYLIRKGYKVIPQYKISNYNSNLLVLSGERKFVIKCYGAKYYSQDEWEENNYKEHQLENIGWKFYRILGSKFYKDKPTVLDELDKALIENRMY